MYLDILPTVIKKALGLGLLMAMIPLAPAETPAKNKPYKIVYIAGIASDPYYIALNRGAQAEAQKQGATVQFSGSPSAFSPSTQIPFLNAAIAQKPDLVMIAPTDIVAMQQPIQTAVSAGIPVILVDTTLKDPSIAITSIGFDNLTGGAQAADALAKVIGGKGKVAVVSTTLGTSTGDDRVRGFNQQMASKYPDIKNIGTSYAGDDTTKAASVLKGLLTSHPDLAGVFTINGIVGDGVTIAAKEAGAENKLKLVEYGSSASQVRGVQNGTVTALIGPSPYTIGELGVRLGIQYLKGKKDLQKHYDTDQGILTKENVDDPKNKPFEY
ncbi:MAG: ribose transport system substrate-binding protein [Verrucomicrobiota bacterium]